MLSKPKESLVAIGCRHSNMEAKIFIITKIWLVLTNTCKRNCNGGDTKLMTYDKLEQVN